MHRYKYWNTHKPTTGIMTGVATGTVTKTMLQVSTPSTRQLQIISWGYTLSALPGATATIELLQTDTAATVTAAVQADMISLDPNAPGSLMTVGAAATGFSASAEGTIGATRVFDCDQIPASSGLVPINYDYQFMPDERPIVASSAFLRIRATTPTSGANMLCWVCWDE